jgi:hypothetical protein
MHEDALMQIAILGGGTVNETILNSGWDTFWVAIPFFALLVMSVFRLDEAFMTPKGVRRRCRPGGMDRNGQPILCDPDGRPSWNGRAAK